MTVSEASMRLAVRNVAHLGDTDVLPYPLENSWFYDDEDSVVSLLQQVDADFDNWVRKFPPLAAKILTSVGYTGFRAVSQIDPLWNAYLLALAIEIAPESELARIEVSRGRVFAYRFAPDSKSNQLFDPAIGWRQFQEAAVTAAGTSKFVLQTDISDFYARVYHHRLDNALRAATANQDAAKRIAALLFTLSNRTSYGLPVGGNASRIFAETLLDRTDRLLVVKGLRFVRFVDDYYFFSDTLDDCRRALIYLSEVLLQEEGLTLSRMKTRVMTQAEFMRHSPAAVDHVADSASEAEVRQILKLKLTHDRYAPNAQLTHEALAAEIQRFDIFALLLREFDKSRIDEVLVRQLLKATRYLPLEQQSKIIESIAVNVEKLHPVFPTVAIVLKRIIPLLDRGDADVLFAKLRTLVSDQSHLVLVPANRAYLIRLLALDPSYDADGPLTQLYDTATDMVSKRDVILAMSRRGRQYWLSNMLNRYGTLTQWEKRAMIVASYVLRDQGRHWRDAKSTMFSPVDDAFRSWVSGKFNGRPRWDLPL